MRVVAVLAALLLVLVVTSLCAPALFPSAVSRAQQQIDADQIEGFAVAAGDKFNSLFFPIRKFIAPIEAQIAQARSEQAKYTDLIRKDNAHLQSLRQTAQKRSADLEVANQAIAAANQAIRQADARIADLRAPMTAIEAKIRAEKNMVRIMALYKNLFALRAKNKPKFEKALAEKNEANRRIQAAKERQSTLKQQLDQAKRDLAKASASPIRANYRSMAKAAADEAAARAADRQKIIGHLVPAVHCRLALTELMAAVHAASAAAALPPRRLARELGNKATPTAELVPQFAKLADLAEQVEQVPGLDDLERESAAVLKEAGGAKAGQAAPPVPKAVLTAKEVGQVVSDLEAALARVKQAATPAAVRVLSREMLRPGRAAEFRAAVVSLRRALARIRRSVPQAKFDGVEIRHPKPRPGKNPLLTEMVPPPFVVA